MEATTLQKALMSLTGTAIVGFSAETEIKLKGGKKNPQQGRITKRINNGNVMLFCNQKSNGYENMVRRRLEKEGKDGSKFKLGSLRWGSRVEGTPFIEHKEQLYLQTIFMQSPIVEYLQDGEPINKDDIEGLPSSEKGGEQGGLSEENKVVVRTYNVDSIKELRYNGEVYK